jgi:3-oxoacyl-ACP reductase-like protein
MRHAILFVTAALLVAGCSKSDSSGNPAAAAAAPAPTPSAAPAGAGDPNKTDYTATELFTAASAMMRLDVMSKPPVNITGTISAVKDDPMGEYSVDLDAGGGHIVTLRFADVGKAEKAAKLKAGASVAAKSCKITVPTGNSMSTTDCVLKT